MIQTEFNGNRDDFGGDIAITSTVPRIHPQTGLPMAGTRESVGMADNYTTFLRGDIISKDNPEAEFNFLLWEDDGSPESKRQYMTYTIAKGFRPAVASEWILRPELAQIYSVENDQLVIVTSTSPTRPAKAVVMVRSKDRWALEQAKLQQVDSIAKESQRRIGDSIADNRVQALPTTVDVIPHQYNPEAVSVKG